MNRILVLLMLAAGSGLMWGQGAPTQPLATVGESAITEKDLPSSVIPQIRQLKNQEYELKKRALETVIQQKLLEAAAKKNNLTVEQLLQQKVYAGIGEPADGEVEAYYLGQRDRLNRPLNEVRDQLRNALRQARRQQALEAYVSGLRESTKVTMLLEPPRTEVAYDPARLLGSADAPVRITIFSDFQCPYCRQVAPTLKQVAGKYGGKVSLAFLDYPLRQIHAGAQRAAEASRCVAEQGKFWEYHDRLFEKSSAFPDAELKEGAQAVGADVARFEACLNSGKYRPMIERDLQNGTQAGVSGTPAFFINGIFLSGNQPASAFEKIIDAELAAAAVKAR